MKKCILIVAIAIGCNIATTVNATADFCINTANSKDTVAVTIANSQPYSLQVRCESDTSQSFTLKPNKRKTVNLQPNEPFRLKDTHTKKTIKLVSQWQQPTSGCTAGLTCNASCTLTAGYAASWVIAGCSYKKA